MSLRGKHYLSRMLITFDPWGGSSKGMMSYLKTSGQSLKEIVERMGGQLVVEVRRNHHPEVRVCYYEGLHLNKAADEARRRHLKRTSELRWRPVPVTRRRRRRAERFRLLDEPPFVTQNPAEEKAALRERVLANDTPSGRRRNLIELEGDLEPDLPPDALGPRYSLMALVTTKGSLKYSPAFGSAYDVKSQERGYKWALWKVWGPSGKVVNCRNLAPGDIAEHMWWLTRTTGQASTKWGNNVARHRVARPSIQGKWTPTAALRLQHERPAFEITELPWERVPEAGAGEERQQAALDMLPFIARETAKQSAKGE